ncbi:MAG: hypothetical protein II467_05750 [Bacilli bacterium]|nr:hypothetical protein [Bacilli bacterium]
MGNVNEFLSQNAWWLALIAAGLILVVALIIILTGIKRKKAGAEKKKKINYKDKESVKSSYFEALGGEDNILEKGIVGSRIKLRLKDYSLLDKKKIEEAGVDAFIQMSDKLYLVVKEDAAKVYSILFGE